MFPNAYVRPSLFSRGLQAGKAINWSGLLDGTQKTLGVINQAIPIVYQVKPLIGNAKAMFKIADALNSSDVRQAGTTSVEQVPVSREINSNSSTNKPVFYV